MGDELVRCEVEPDEWYPVYGVQEIDADDAAYPMFVPAALLGRYRAALAEWEAVQGELAALSKAANEERRRAWASEESQTNE